MDPLLRVGGPATAGLAWVSDFINFTQAEGVPVDFVSTHSYPSDYRHNFSAATRTIWEDDIIAQAAIAEAAGLPLVMTEISAGLNDAYDSYFAGAFVAHAAAAFLGVANVPTLSFWTFTGAWLPPPRRVCARRRRGPTGTPRIRAA